MLTRLSFLILISYLCLCEWKFCSGDDEPPLVRVKQGMIRGITEKSLNGREFYSYLSIPFAKPPVGKLRFKGPVPLESWDDVLNGTKAPVHCLQKGFFSFLPDQLTLVGREDCLHLNVHTTAANQREKKLPVMVFIHGGGFIGGGANDCPPKVLMDKDIVLVVIQYRLGIFGFLSTEDSVMPGNMGLKDQQLALKWVKENIEVFGGDSNMITIFGISAGGASVHYQVLSPGSKGLFNRAIIQSGTALNPWATNKNHRKFAIETGQEFNCSLDFGTEKYLECMQAVNPHYLAIASSETNILGFVPFYVLPRVDGEFIEEAPEILMKKGKYNKVEIISGITRDEGGLDLFFDLIIPNRRENINKNFEKLGPLSLYFHDEKNPLELTKEVYQYYLQRDDVTTTEDDWKEIVDMNSDRMFKIGHDIVHNFFAADKNIKLYTYQYDYFGHISFADILPGLKRRNIIGHGEDVFNLFEGGLMTVNIKLEDEEDLKMRGIILDLWINFAETGNPTPSGSGFTWDEATRDSFRYLSLTTSPVMKNDDYQKNRKFWSSLKTSQNLFLQTSSKEEL